MHFCETIVIGHARGSGFRKAVQFLREYPPPVGTNKTREELSLACQTGHFEEKIENDTMLSPKLQSYMQTVCKAYGFFFSMKIYCYSIKING